MSDTTANLWIGESLPLSYTGLRLGPTSPYKNDATITATVRQADGSVLGTPVTLAYVASSNGDYAGTLPASVTAAMVEGSVYTIEFASVGLLARYVRGVAQKRGAA